MKTRTSLAFCWALLAAAALSIVVISDAVATPSGPYSCCGNSSCTTLHAHAACPGGSGDCDLFYNTCCVNLCYDPQV